MATTSKVIGILGSVIAFLFSLILLANTANFEGYDSINAGMNGWLIQLASIAAFVGAILAKNNPKVGGIIMLASAIVAVAAIASYGFELALVILPIIIGGVLALVAHFTQRDPQY